MGAAGYAVGSVVKDVLKDAAGDTAANAVWRAVINGNWTTVSMQTDRALLRYTISNEKTIYSALSPLLKSLEMPAKMSGKKTVDGLLALDSAEFGQVNLGVRCWYLSRVWSLMCLAPPTELTFEECKKGFVDFVSKCEDEMVASFVRWITGPDFSREDFLQCMQTFSHGLLPPLRDVVYGYLATPPADLVRRDILSLI